MANLLNIIFDDLGILLLGYRFNKVNLFYNPQRHSFIRCGYDVQMKVFCFLF